MPKLKLDWKQYCCWVCDLNVISVHKSLKFVTYSRAMVNSPLSPMALSTSMINTRERDKERDRQKQRHRENYVWGHKARQMFGGARSYIWSFMHPLTFNQPFLMDDFQIHPNVITMVFATTQLQLRMNFNQYTSSGMDLCLVVQARIWEFF